MAEPAEQISSRGVVRVVAVQLKRVHDRERGGRAVDLADRDGAVEGHDRGRSDREQLVVEGDDLRPVGLLERGGSAWTALMAACSW